jgi:hypothetical protein
MKKATVFAAVLAAAVIAAAGLGASDRMSVYAKVDKVILEPSAEAPTTVQIWGVFSIAHRANPNDYQPAARGYLYYSLPSRSPELARREWNDLKSIAGTGEIVAFGSRWEGVPRLRQADDKPSNPDAYTLNTGVTKVQGNTQYAPISALINFSR